jgi:hypothetical protein
MGSHDTGGGGGDGMSKRFTDAELAAEWQMAKRHEAVSVICRLDTISRDMSRLRVVERFATMPNYDEVTA